MSCPLLHAMLVQVLSHADLPQGTVSAAPWGWRKDEQGLKWQPKQASILIKQAGARAEVGWGKISRVAWENH